MCMVSQDKLIKEGIKYTDKLFDEISKRLEKGVLTSDTLEEFLRKTKAYTSNNPLVTTEYDKTLLNLILAETNNHKFSRPAQKELVRVTIENQVGELIRDVGEDIKESVRDIVKEGYNEGLSQQEIADNITSRVSAIKGRRARTIARTEIARTATISDYIINTERGATHFYVECRNTACPICKEAWHEKWSPDNDESFTPSETSAGGRGWVGDKRFPVSDVDMLPPIHPNCRCVAYFIKEGGSKTKTGTGNATKAPVETTPKVEVKPKAEPEPKDLTREQLDKMDFKQLAEHHEAEYKGVQVYDYDDRKYHVFEQKYDNGKTLTVRFEEGAVKAYDKAGIATPNEIVHEVFKVPDALKRQTDEVWFKNTNHGIQHRYSKSGYDSLGNTTGGYNAYKMPGNGRDDPNHRIVINPKNFKGGGKGRTAYLWKKDPDNANDWKHVIHHEFTHSIDRSRESYQGIDARPLSHKERFRKVHKKERFFTWYSNTDITEEFAEHGGYISRMHSNPNDQSKKFKVKLYDADENRLINKEITFNEYKELYPEHYDYFTKLFKGEIPCY